MSSWRQTIRWKLSISAAGGLAVLGLVFVGGAYAWFRTTMEDDLRAFARHEADEVSNIVANAQSEEELHALAPVLGQLLPEDGVISLELWSLDGRRLHHLPEREGPTSSVWQEGLEAARRGVVSFSDVRADGLPSALRTAIGVPDARAPRWIATVSVRRDRVDRALASFAFAGVVGVAVAALATLAGTALVVSRALRPVQDLVRSAQLISREGPGRRLAEPPSGSELAELARLLNRMLAETEQTVERLRRFTGHVGHELRTPLARLHAEAEAALTRGDPAANRSALEGVLEEVEALRRVIDRLLELARGEENVRDEAEPLDLTDLVREIVEEAAVVARETGVHVELVLADPASVRGSRTLLARAVWNLIDNALRFSPEGGRIHVRLVAPEGAWAVLEIEDEGPGLEAEGDPEKLFEPFVRGKLQPERGGEGHGLGLALTRAVAQRHGGRLSAMPPGALGGARFRLLLPLEDEAP